MRFIGLSYATFVRNIICRFTMIWTNVQRPINVLMYLKRSYKVLLAFMLCAVILTSLSYGPSTCTIFVDNRTQTERLDTLSANIRLNYDYDDISVDLYSLRSNLSNHQPDKLSVSLGQKKEVQEIRKITGQENYQAFPVCPKLPAALAGFTSIDTALVSYSHMLKRYHHLHSHGRFYPLNCRSQQRMALIIPYRKRLHHLLILLNNLIPFLIRQQADVTFFVVEQLPGTTFNKGLLLNIGFLEALKLEEFDCFIFHDVDLIPLNDKNLYRCGDNPRHFSVAINKFSYSLLYPGIFGGVVGLTKHQVLAINGYSNLYFGWGGEDDDFLERVMNKGYYISRYAPNISKYFMINHTRDQGNESNPYRMKLLEAARLRQEVDGLNSIRYNKTVKDMGLFKLVSVNVDNAQFILNAPNFIQDIFTVIESVRSTAVVH